MLHWVQIFVKSMVYDFNLNLHLSSNFFFFAFIMEEATSFKIEKFYCTLKVTGSSGQYTLSAQGNPNYASTINKHPITYFSFNLSSVCYLLSICTKPNLLCENGVPGKFRQVHELQVQRPKFSQDAAPGRRPSPVPTGATGTKGKAAV